MKQCLKCRLLNPDSATTCDCGFDLTAVSLRAGTDRNPVKVPFAIKAHFALQLLAVALMVYRFANEGPRRYSWQPTEAQLRQQALGFVIWVVVSVSLYFHLMAHKNWARIALGIWTLPSGLLLFSSNAKTFTQMPGEDRPSGLKLH